MNRKLALAALGGVVVAGAASAHTPYLKPTTFAPDRDFVTVEAALTEGNFFVPDFPIRQAGDYWATGNDGAPVKITSVTMLKEFVAVEASLPATGTYRLSTGERAGRSMKWAKVGGEWKTVRPAGGQAMRGGDDRSVEEAAIPAGAETMTSTSFMRAETYVSRGAPNRGALKPTGQGLEIEPVTHPNEAFAGEAFKFKLLLDGKPLPAQAYDVARAGDAYAEKKFNVSEKTDAAGAASVMLAQPGVYVIEVNYPIRAEGSRVPVPKSAIYSLSFEVTR